jgi:Leucine-rich repeat (LRR) protein
LNLHGHCLRKIENLSPCKNLRVLVLSFNELSKIEGLSDLHRLQRLEIGFNLIKRISGLKNMTSLKRLEMNNNLLNRLEDIQSLSKQAVNLTYLDLRNNPMCKARTYRSSVLESHPLLAQMDGNSILPGDRNGESLMSKAVGVTMELIREVGFGISPSGVEGDRPGAGGNGQWMGMVQELDCSNKNLQYICNLENLVNLRKANFSDNEINVIEGLEENGRLEELNLESNRISVVEGLQGLTRLRKLELGHNKILKIPANMDIFTRCHTRTMNYTSSHLPNPPPSPTPGSRNSASRTTRSPQSSRCSSYHRSWSSTSATTRSRTWPRSSGSGTCPGSSSWT